MNPAADCRGSPSDSAKASCGYKLASLAKLPLALFSFNGLPSLDEKVVKLTAGSSVAGCTPQALRTASTSVRVGNSYDAPARVLT